MKLIGKILATLIGVIVIWLAVTMAFGLALISPSTTAEGEVSLAITRTWYGEIARYGSAGLLGFLGVTLAAAPWRARKGAAENGSS